MTKEKCIMPAKREKLKTLSFRCRKTLKYFSMAIANKNSSPRREFKRN